MAKFKEGEIHNPFGRPKGSGSRQKLFNSLVLPYQHELVNTAIKLALNGNECMLRIFLDRLLPSKPMDDPIGLSFNLEDLTKIEYVAVLGKEVLRLVADGKITLKEAHAATALLESHSKLIEHSELKSKLEQIQEAINRG